MTATPPRTARPRTRALLPFALLAALAAVPASAQGNRPAPEVLRLGGVRSAAVTVRARACATPEVGAAEAEVVRSALRRWEAEDAGLPAAAAIRVAVHVLTSGGEGDVDDDRLTRLIGELNEALGPHGHRFELARVDRTEAPAWFRMAPGSAAEADAKRALAVEPGRHLNLYLCSPAEGVAGWASYPWSAPESEASHGVVVDHAALADGAAAREAGHAVAHQVGHYLGLLEADLRGAPARVGSSDVAPARPRSAAALFRPSLFAAPTAPLGGRSEISPTAGAEPEDGRVLSYRGAFPNPFRAETMLRFTLPVSGPVSLRIYAVTGRLVRTLVDASLPPGDHSAMFRAGDLPSGAYFAVLRAGSVQMTRTLMLVR